MSLADDFKNASHPYTFTKQNDFVLSANFSGSLYYYYDFLARVMISKNAYGQESGCVPTPFSQLDPETLAFFRDKLVALGGKPPELPDYSAPARLPGKPSTRPQS